ncbi:MAG: recombination protein RecR [Chloroflexi bacterium]|jgi:recombination protein RecR|uniref:Recombination protein RecR n=1 Tax=Candidatus Thermofonsia Clade 3 bacterium TaxID=2364212 RepID=A0A2M8QDH2_9CHLR|nr:recombination mediator RecR [Candidatus Roseilinea sp. NK_OTU-006]PJF47851.1 MAG: recombination protein RecR [Candidatus Thermofonsia Clade 3 bacterium]RMG63559.1 MAG: recombination protein RecR [Chloroflexota bacterium]
MSPNPTLPPSVTRLIDALTQLPGIGPKSASRLAFFLLRAPAETSLTLAEALRDLKARTRLCSVCFNITEDDPCAICADPLRDPGLICVVEEPLDVAAIERSRVYHGTYHVLHGVISPINGVGPDDLRIEELVGRIRRSAEAGQPVREVILATNPTVEGEMTASFIQRKLAGLEVSITRLARGLPAGGDLEYADEITLRRALEGRQRL